MAAREKLKWAAWLKGDRKNTSSLIVTRPCSLIAFLILLLSFVSVEISLAEESHPIRHTQYIEWFDQFRKNQGNLNLALTHDEEGKAVANSCDDLRRLTHEGYYAPTQFGINRVLEYSSACVVLELIDNGKPATKSYLESFVWTPDIVRELPKQLAESLGTLNDSNMRAEFEKSKNFLDVFEIYTSQEGRYSLEIINPHRFEMVYDERTSSVYQIIAFADFNEDGIEDMLLSYAEYPGGSLHLYGHMILTQLESDGRLQKIERL